MAIIKVIEIMGDSDTSWEDATATAIAKASETIKDIQSAWVKDQSVTVKNGKVDAYRVGLKVSFKVK